MGWEARGVRKPCALPRVTAKWPWASSERWLVPAVPWWEGAGCLRCACCRHRSALQKHLETGQEAGRRCFLRGATKPEGARGTAPVKRANMTHHPHGSACRHSASSLRRRRHFCGWGIKPLEEWSHQRQPLSVASLSWLHRVTPLLVWDFSSSVSARLAKKSQGGQGMLGTSARTRA